jgi:hypothetical protein
MPVALPKAKKILTANVADLYPDVEIKFCFVAGPGRTKGIGPLTATQAKQLLKWETEDDYKKRMEVEAKGDVTKAAKKIAGFGEEYLLKDTKGNKVKCWNNDGNRPFTISHAYEMAQDILNRRFKLNLENIIISRTGKILSGAHRLVALVLAAEMWANDADWQRKWQTEPVIETLVAFGGAEDPDTKQTLDNVRPRTLGDIFYTSPIFEALKTYERNECSRSLDYAVDLLWSRTRAGEDKFSKYQTHSTSMDFFDRHPRLKVAVKFIFDNNKDRQISSANLNTGHAATMLYLMGACASSREVYNKDPGEKSIDWRYWEKAVDFWTLFAKRDDAMQPIREAIGGLADIDSGVSGRASEKLATLIKAWLLFINGKPITAEDLELEYGQDGNGNRVLAENPTCGGIDLGMRRKVVEEIPSPEEIAARAAAERAARLAEMQKTIADAKPAANIVTKLPNGQGVMSTANPAARKPPSPKPVPKK